MILAPHGSTLIAEAHGTMVYACRVVNLAYDEIVLGEEQELVTFSGFNDKGNGNAVLGPCFHEAV